MPKLTDKNSFFGSITGRWLATDRNQPLDGAGMERPRSVHVDFGRPKAKSLLNSGQPLFDDAAFVTQVGPPTTMNPGQVAAVTVTMRNSGTSTWTAGVYTFHSQAPTDNNNWGLTTVPLGSPVAPAAQTTFSFSVTAPTTPGTYNFQWRMKSATTLFGEQSGLIVVTVVAGPPPPADNAAFVSYANVPATMTPGQIVSVSVTMNNTGTTTWTVAGGYKLGSQNPQDNMTWGLNRVVLSGSVAPAANNTFTFNITAPLATGSYNFQWRMINEGAATFFGAASPNQVIQVVAPACTTGDFITNIIKVGSDPTDTCTFEYVAAVYDAAPTVGGKLIRVSNPKSIFDAPCPPTSLRPMTVYVSLPIVNQPLYVELYRKSTTYTSPVSPPDPASSLGVIDIRTTLPLQPNVLMDEFGQQAGLKTIPSCASFVSLLPLPANSVLPNILNGIKVDGSQGGKIINGEWVFDFVDPNFPANIDSLPTSDWPRSLTVYGEGQTFNLRILGLTGWGESCRDTGMLPPQVVGTGGASHWKVRRVIVSNPGPGRLWVGWSDELELKYPYRVNDEDTGFESGYLNHTYQNSLEVQPPWTAILGITGQGQIIHTPAKWNRRGVFVPPTPLNAIDHWEVDYMSDSGDNLTSAKFRKMLADGIINPQEE